MAGEVSRRNALKFGAASVLAAAAGCAQKTGADPGAPTEGHKGKAPQAIASGEKIRVGFIGTGGRGRAVMNAMLKNDQVEVVAICDITPKNLQAGMEMVEKKHGKKPEAYDKGPDDYKRMLERNDLHAVGMATPCNLHAAMFVAAIEAGKHIYGEKPMGICVKELDAVCKAAEANPKLVVQIGYQWMANPRFIEAIDRVHRGEIGDLVEGRFARHNGASPLRGWFSHRKESGDWMLEQACHEFNVMNWLFQGHPLEAFARGRQDIWTEGEPGRDVTDFYSAILTYPKNVIVNYSHDWHSPEGLTGMDLKAVGMKGAMDIFGGRFTYREKGKAPSPLKAPGVDDTQEAVNVFVKCILTGTKPMANPHYGRLASHVGLMIRRSIDTKKVITYEEMLKTC